MNLFAMSVCGGVLILVTVLLRAVFAEKLPQKTFLALWAVALGRLLFPFRLPSPVSVYNAQPLAKVYAPALGAGAQAEGVPADIAFPWLTALWAAGAAACALFFIAAWVRCRLEFREALPVADERPRRWLLAQGLRRAVCLRQSDRVSAPLTYGLLRPVILLPKTMDWDNSEQAQYVLTHELVHIRRLDSLWKLLLIAALCLHWFNPLVWVMVLLANRDLEISCDESVVRTFGSGARRGYALTLLGMEERRGALRPLCNSFSKNAIEERIRAIMNGKKTTLMTILSGLAVVTAVTLVFATSAQAEDVPTATAGATGTVVQDKGFISTKGNIAAVTEGSAWKDPDDIKPDPETGKYYTKAQYNKIAALRADGSEKQSIAQFNRELRAKFYGNETDDSLFEAFEYVRAELPADDPLAQWVYYTVPASLNEYEARIDEVYSGKRHDPSFSAEATRTDHADVYGDQVQINYAGISYSFTYRILQQDTLTVQARDSFLLAVTDGMQEYLNKLDVKSLKDDATLEKAALEELGRLGKSSTTDAIEYTGGAIEWSQYEPSFDY